MSALPLLALRSGLRNVVTVGARLVHQEARTRGATVPASDFRRSFEVYEPCLPSLELDSNPHLSPRDSCSFLRPGRVDMLARRNAR